MTCSLLRPAFLLPISNKNTHNNVNQVYTTCAIVRREVLSCHGSCQPGLQELVQAAAANAVHAVWCMPGPASTTSNFTPPALKQHTQHDDTVCGDFFAKQAYQPHVLNNPSWHASCQGCWHA